MTQQDELGSFILSNFGYKLDGRSLEPDLDLLGEGIIDSMGVMEIVLFLEETFDVSIDDADIVPANFRSLRSLARLVSQNQTAAGVSQDAAS